MYTLHGQCGHRRFERGFQVCGLYVCTQCTHYTFQSVYIYMYVHCTHTTSPTHPHVHSHINYASIYIPLAVLHAHYCTCQYAPHMPTTAYASTHLTCPLLHMPVHTSHAHYCTCQHIPLAASMIPGPDETFSSRAPPNRSSEMRSNIHHLSTLMP